MKGRIVGEASDRTPNVTLAPMTGSMASGRSTADILQDARDTLYTAQLGLADIQSADPERRIPGLRNVVVFGRAVTNVLQNLRSTESEFDSWYAPYVEEMRSDPVLRYLYQLRSEVLKQGSVATSTSAFIGNFNTTRDRHLWGSPPPNATSIFIGDRLGGSGWMVRLPDGSEEPYYVSLPKSIAETHLHLPNAPLGHRGEVLADNRLQTVGAAYLQYLSDLVDAARRRFAPSRLAA